MASTITTTCYDSDPSYAAIRKRLRSSCGGGAGKNVCWSLCLDPRRCFPDADDHHAAATIALPEDIATSLSCNTSITTVHVCVQNFAAVTPQPQHHDNPDNSLSRAPFTRIAQFLHAMGVQLPQLQTFHIRGAALPMSLLAEMIQTTHATSLHLTQVKLEGSPTEEFHLLQQALRHTALVELHMVDCRLSDETRLEQRPEAPSLLDVLVPAMAHATSLQRVTLTRTTTHNNEHDDGLGPVSAQALAHLAQSTSLQEVTVQGYHHATPRLLQAVATQTSHTTRLTKLHVSLPHDSLDALTQLLQQSHLPTLTDLAVTMVLEEEPNSGKDEPPHDDEPSFHAITTTADDDDQPWKDVARALQSNTTVRSFAVWHLHLPPHNSDRQSQLQLLADAVEHNRVLYHCRVVPATTTTARTTTTSQWQRRIDHVCRLNRLGRQAYLTNEDHLPAWIDALASTQVQASLSCLLDFVRAHPDRIHHDG